MRREMNPTSRKTENRSFLDRRRV